MKLNRRVGDTLNLVKVEYEAEYRSANESDLVGEYLHALCSYYGELIGKNVSLSNPIEFACKYYRLYLQGLLEDHGYLGDQSLSSFYLYLNGLILHEIEASKIRFKEAKVALWKQYSNTLFEEFVARRTAIV